MCRSIFGGRSELSVGLWRWRGRSSWRRPFSPAPSSRRGPSWRASFWRALSRHRLLGSGLLFRRLRRRGFLRGLVGGSLLRRSVVLRLIRRFGGGRRGRGVAAARAVVARSRVRSVRGGSGAGSGVSCGRSCGCAIRLLLCRISSRTPARWSRIHHARAAVVGLAVVGFGRSVFVSHGPQCPAADKNDGAQNERPDRQVVG